mgnify:CR=1 FL=1
MKLNKSSKTNRKLLAIIPARQGSKRLPNKNIIKLAGRPLLYYVITALKKSRIPTKILVSSDSDEILKVAKKYGVSISKRPKYLATDKALSTDVVRYEIKKLKNEHFDYVMLCQPTSPLLSPRTIRLAFKKMIAKRYDCLFSITKVKMHPRYYRTVRPNGTLSQFLNLKTKSNQSFYQHNGAIYLYRTDFLLRSKSWFPFSKRNSGYIEMSWAESIDIDTLDDLTLAETIIRGKLHERN